MRLIALLARVSTVGERIDSLAIPGSEMLIFLSFSSSSVFSLLPPRPKIFHGRDVEVNDIVTTLKQDSPRVAILGTGGIGKTALALTAIHHSDIEAIFTHRYFISCESASNSADIVSALAAQLDIADSAQALKAVVRHLSSAAAAERTLLVLDNLETPWEPPTSRGDVEGVLTHLTDIPHLGLLVSLPCHVRFHYYSATLGYDAWSRTTRQGAMDAAVPSAIGAALPRGCDADASGYSR